MITDKLSNAASYFNAFPALEKICETVGKIKSGELSCGGKTEIDGDRLFYSVSSYTTKSPEGAEYESHRIYADVQVILKGSEVIGWAPLSECTVTQNFKDGGDIAFYKSEYGSPVLLTENSFMIMLPGDAHMPCLQNKAPSEVTKAVFKVKLKN